MKQRSGVISALVDVAEDEGARWVRLSVNLSPQVAEVLKGLAEKHRVTVTEEVRRAISVWKFIDDELSAGSKILVEKKGGRTRELVL